MKLVSQLLKEKGHHVWTVAPETAVIDALQLMADKDIGAAVVVDEGEVVGIFSERDYARKLILQGKSSKDTPVADIMTTRVIGVRPDQSVTKCMAIMTDKRIRHLPVLKDDELVGVISIGDVVKAIISEQQVMINHLEDYIYGEQYSP